MKTLLKYLLIPLLASRPVTSIADIFISRGVPIFMLHRVAASSTDPNVQTADNLRKCLQYLLDNNYTFISLEELILAIKEKLPLPKNSVAFTMDDGYLDQAEIVAPIFLEFNCPLTFFVITGFLDQKLWPWDTQVSWIISNTEKTELTLNFSDEPLNIKIGPKNNRSRARKLVRNYFKKIDASQISTSINQLAEAANIEPPETPPVQDRALNWQQARSLEKQGIRFAPHSITHRIMSKLDGETAKHEILKSWKTLQDELESPLNVFCYPTGRITDYGSRETEILKNNGFIGAVSTTESSVDTENSPEKQLYALPRVSFPNNMPDFIQCCSWIEKAKNMLRNPH